MGNKNQIRLVMHAVAYMEFGHTESLFKVAYTDLGGANYYDKTYTYVITLGVDQNGHLEVTSTQSSADNSAAYNFQAKGLMGLFGAGDNVKSGLSAVDTGNYFRPR